MVQPLMLPSTTTSDLKAHKEKEIITQSNLSDEQNGPEQKQQAFSQLLSENIDQNKGPNTAISFEGKVDENEVSKSVVTLTDSKVVNDNSETQISEEQSSSGQKQQLSPQLISNSIEENKDSKSVVTSVDSKIVTSDSRENTVEEARGFGQKQQVQPQLLKDKIEEKQLFKTAASTDSEVLYANELQTDETEYLSISPEAINGTNQLPQIPQEDTGGELTEQESNLATFNETTDQTQLNSSTVNIDELGDKNSLQFTNTLVSEQGVEVASPQKTPIILSTINSHKINVENDQSSNSEQLGFQGIDDETEDALEEGAVLAFENAFEQPSTLKKNDTEDLEVNKSEAFTFDNLNGQVTKDNFGAQKDSIEGVDSTISLSNGDAIQSQQAQLLSSIQDAQQINTNVNNRSENSANGVEKMSLLGVKESVQSSILNASQEQEVALEEGKQEGLSTLSNKTIDLTKDQPNLVLPETVHENESLDSKDSTLPTLKVEGQALAQTVMDVNGAKPIQSSIIQSDRVVSMNQHMQATNNLLQEPLDIQSKQAAHMMGERVMMMLSEGKQEVQIRLDPAELGSMFIKVQVQQDQVQLNIQTQASLSKDIIDQNMPRLREQLAQQGIQLGDANVEQQSQQQQQSEQRQSMQAMNSRSANHTDIVEDNSTAIWMPSKITSNEQGIDYYA